MKLMSPNPKEASKACISVKLACKKIVDCDYSEAYVVYFIRVTHRIVCNNVHAAAVGSHQHKEINAAR